MASNYGMIVVKKNVRMWQYCTDLRYNNGMCFEGQNKLRVVYIVAEIRSASLPNTNNKHYSLAVRCKTEQFSTQVQYQPLRGNLTLYFIRVLLSTAKFEAKGSNSSSRNLIVRHSDGGHSGPS
jgi:hypothetical protein